MKITFRKTAGSVVAVGALVVGGAVSVMGAEQAEAITCTPTSWSTFGSTANNLYVSAELGYTGGSQGMLRARAGAIGPWERFAFVGLSGGHYAIRSNANGLYVSAELGNTGDLYAMLRARAGAIGPWEQFDVVAAGGACAIRSVANGRYVSAELGYGGSNNAMLRARASVVGPWELFAPNVAGSSQSMKLVLRRESVTRSWLTKPHHDYPAADIPVPTGTPYYAIVSGTVTKTSSTGSCGDGYVLAGNDGVKYTYCHGSRRDVASGASVAAGQQLGLTGNSGRSTGPHLHFQIKTSDGRLRCPQNLLVALYDGTPAPQPSQLPTSGCTY